MHIDRSLAAKRPAAFDALTPAQKAEQEVLDARRALARAEEVLEAYNYGTQQAAAYGWTAAGVRSNVALLREEGDFETADAYELVAADLDAAEKAA